MFVSEWFFPQVAYNTQPCFKGDYLIFMKQLITKDME